MKPTGWFPITTPPVRNGEYNVRDSDTGQIDRWHWHGVPGGDGRWSIPALGVDVTVVPPTLEWCGLTDEIWTTRDGRQMAVFEMDPEHCRNALRMILRKKRERDMQMVHSEMFKRLSSDWERGE